MSDLTLQRCGNHPDREAAARCPACLNFFCRECVTEHEGRMICSQCLHKIGVSEAKGGRLGIKMLRWVRAMAGLFIVWLFFFGIGRILLMIPSEFHEGTLWQGKWWQEE